MKKNKKVYLDVLKSQFRMNIFILFIIIIKGVICIKSINNQLESEENGKINGEKINATVIKIDEMNNPLKDPYKEKRNIDSITLQYNYKNKNYTYNTEKIPYKNVRVNDIINIYILNNNPNEVVVPIKNTNIVLYFAVPLLSIVIITIIYDLISLIISIRFYNKALKEFDTITAQYVDVETKSFLGIHKLYIICESNEINGTKMRFKSHPYQEHYLKTTIEKKNIEQFKVMINRNNIKQYIVDTNKIDKLMYS